MPPGWGAGHPTSTCHVMTPSLAEKDSPGKPTSSSVNSLVVKAGLGGFQGKFELPQCLCVRTCACVHVCMHVCVHVCECACVCTCMCALLTGCQDTYDMLPSRTEVLVQEPDSQDRRTSAWRPGQ